MHGDYDSFDDLRYCRKAGGTFASPHRDTVAAIIDARANFAYVERVCPLYISVVHTDGTNSRWREEIFNRIFLFFLN